MNRTARILFALATAGSLIGTLWLGWRTGLGFLIGAAVSALSYWRWTRLVNSIGTEPKSAGALGSILRFSLLTVVLYVIVKYLGVNTMAACVGLLTAAAAVIVEILYELIYART